MEKEYTRIDTWWYWGQGITIIIDGCSTVELQIPNDEKNKPQITRVIVHPDKRNKGIATKLINICEDISKNELHAEYISLRVAKNNNWIIEWYKKHNYSIIWEEEHEYYMIKKL